MNMTLMLWKRDDGLSKYSRVESCTFYVFRSFYCPSCYIFLLKEHFQLKTISLIFFPNKIISLLAFSLILLTEENYCVFFVFYHFYGHIWQMIKLLHFYICQVLFFLPRFKRVWVFLYTSLFFLIICVLLFSNLTGLELGICGRHSELLLLAREREPTVWGDL